MLTMRPKLRSIICGLTAPGDDVKAGEVGVDGAAPVVERGGFVGDVFEDACVVHEHVDRAKLFVDIGNHCFDCLLIGNVGLGEHRFGAGGFDQCGGGFGIGGAATVVDGYVRAGAG